MKFTFAWLKDYLDTQASLEQIVEGLYGIGLEVEAIEDRRKPLLPFTVAFVALYVGYRAQPTPVGVSRATTQTVVVSSLAILALDFILTALMFSTT